MNETQLEYLKSVILAQLLLEANENLRLTTQYKQQIKHKINSLNKDLELVVFEEYTKIYKTDAEMTINILNAIDDLVLKLTSSTLDDLVLINAVIEKYKENKEWFTQYGGTEFLKLK